MLDRVGAFPSSLDRCKPCHKILLPSNNPDNTCRAPAWGGAAGAWLDFFRVQGLWVMMPWTVPGHELGVHHTRGHWEPGLRKPGGMFRWALGAERLVSAFASLRSPRGPGLCLIHPVAPVSSIEWPSVTQVNWGTTSLASYERLLRDGAVLGQLAGLEPLQPDGPLCRLSVHRQTHPMATPPRAGL